MTIKNFILDALGKFWTKLKATYVTNCASTSDNLALAASQGKALQDQITTLNSKLTPQNVTIGNANYDTNYIDSANLYYVKYGNVIQMSGWIKTKAVTIPNTSQLVTGLPTAKGTIYILGSDGTTTYRFGMDINASFLKMSPGKTFSSATTIAFSGCYISKE